MTLPPLCNRLPTLQFAHPWQLIRPELISDPQLSAQYDEDLLLKVGRGEIGPSICIKSEPRCLVVTRREARMDNFDQACVTLAAEGWPVAVRCTGGSCVPQGPGMLNLSLMHPGPAQWSLQDGYQLLCELFGRLLAGYDIEATSGEVSGSFCDGRYNLQTGGKKLVGTAQRWAGGQRETAAVLAHACLLVDLDLHEATAKINRLYQLCNNPQRFDAAACTTLRAAQPQSSQLDRETFTRSVEQRLATLVSEAFAIPSPEKTVGRWRVR